MSVDITEPTTPPTQRNRKRKALRSDLFTKDLFEEKNLPPDHKNAFVSKKFTYCIIKYLICWNICNICQV